MTIGIGYLDGRNSCWLGCDTMVTYGGMKELDDDKLVQHRTGLAFVSSGVRIGKVAMVAALDAATKGAREVSVRAVEDALREEMDRMGWHAGPEDVGMPGIREVNFLLTDGTTLWEVNAAGIASRRARWGLVGDGYPIAMGALYAGTHDLLDHLPTEQLVRIAVDACIEHSSGCGGHAIVRQVKPAKVRIQA